ncbi:MAG: leucine-rich repeat domain-containing protein [Culicoidibacterales bacterium]
MKKMKINKVIGTALTLTLIGGNMTSVTMQATQNNSEVTTSPETGLKVPEITIKKDNETKKPAPEIAPSENPSAPVTQIAPGKNNKSSQAISVIFPDAVLAEVIAAQFTNTSVDDTITQADLDKIRVISASIYDHRPAEITRIRGVERLTNLEEITLNGQNITDVSDLAKLKKLRVVGMRGNNVQDLTPLASIKTLEELYLAENKITSIRDIATLKTLKVLDLDGNRIIDITPLSGLINLEKLYLGDNRIEDIEPLRYLSKLTSLFADGNRLTDVTVLKQAKKLTYVTLFEQVIILPSVDPTERVTVTNPIKDEYGAAVSVPTYLINDGGTYDAQTNSVSFANTRGLEDVSYRFQTPITINGTAVSFTGSVRLPLTGKALYNTPPTIKAADVKLTLGDPFNPKTGVEAVDIEDGTLPAEIIQNTVNTAEVGTYLVEYKAVDSKGLITTKKIKVEVHPVHAPEITSITAVGKTTKITGRAGVGNTIHIILTNDIKQAPVKKSKIAAIDPAIVEYTVEADIEGNFIITIPLEPVEGNTFGVFATKNKYRSPFAEYKVAKPVGSGPVADRVVDRVDHIEAGDLPVLSGITLPNSVVSLTPNETIPAKKIRSDHNGFWQTTLNGYVRHNEAINITIHDGSNVEIANKVVIALDTKAPGDPNLATPLLYREGQTRLNGISERHVGIELFSGDVLLGSTTTDSKTGKWELSIAKEFYTNDIITIKSTDEGLNTSEYSYTITGNDAQASGNPTQTTNPSNQQATKALPQTGQNTTERIILGSSVISVALIALYSKVKTKTKTSK